MLLLVPQVSALDAAKIEAGYLLDRFKGQPEFCRVVGERLLDEANSQEG